MRLVVLRAVAIAIVFESAACVGDDVAPADGGSSTASSDAGSSPEAAPALDAGPALSVATIRNSLASGHPPMGTAVRVEGLVVTNVKRSGTSRLFFAQDPTLSSWAGIVIFVGPADPSVSPGDVVTAVGTYTSYKGLEEIDVTAGSYERTGTASVPAPIDVGLTDINAGGARALELQSMLLRIKEVTATTPPAPPPSMEFTVTATATSGATLQIASFYANDVGAPLFPATQGQAFASITGNGVMSAAGSSQPVGKLAPGRAADFVPK